MDPITNLDEQITLARKIQTTIDAAPEEGMSDQDRRDNEDRGERLAELVLAFHDWRRSGGFDPLSPMTPALRDEIRDALEGDSNDTEHDVLAAVAAAFDVDWTAPE